jgi:CheY-like chemotaxis protein
MERCRELGVTSYLLKPVRKLELQVAIGKALGEKDLSTQPDTAAQRDPVARVRALRILVAEDNSVNQTVALRTLEKMGHSVVIANDGQEALSLLAQLTFDLVLMDIQMPRMDGLTATRKIRESELPGHPQMPIIAMTALAMKGDKERCLEGGMNGYVSKPINRKELEEALASVVKGLMNTGPAEQETDSSNAFPTSPFGWDSGEVLDGLGGDKQLLCEIVEIFLAETPKNLEAMRQAITRKDSKKIERIAHSLKGELGYLRVPGASQKARELEDMGRACDLHCAADSFAALEAEILAVIDSMKRANGVTPEKALAVSGGATQ